MHSGANVVRNAPGRRRRGWLLVLLSALLCVACPSVATQPPIRWEAPATLGTPEPACLLARGYLVHGDPQEPGFGYYAYLVFQPDTSDDQKRFAAEAFLRLNSAREYQTLHEKVERKGLALLVAPIKSRREPATAAELVADYDGAFASIITKKLRDAGLELDPVALVGHLTPITQASPPLHDDFLAGDACGQREEVNAKFQRLRTGLLRGNVYREGRFVRFAATLGRILTRGTTMPCL